MDSARTDWCPMFNHIPADLHVEIVDWKPIYGNLPVIISDSTLGHHLAPDCEFHDAGLVVDKVIRARILFMNGGTFITMKAYLEDKLRGFSWKTHAVVPAFRSLPAHKQCHYEEHVEAQKMTFGKATALPAIMDMNPSFFKQTGGYIYKESVKKGGVHIRKQALGFMAACLVSFAADVNLVIGWNSSRPIKEYEEQAAFIVKGYV